MEGVHSRKQYMRKEGEFGKCEGVIRRIWRKNRSRSQKVGNSREEKPRKSMESKAGSRREEV